MNTKEKLLDFFLGDFWKFFALGAILVAAVHFTSLTWADFTNPPLWAKVGAVFSGIGLVGGYMAATVWYDPPEPDWQYLHEYNTDDPATPRVYRVTPEVIDNLAVYGGRRLHSPQGRENEYVCRFFNGDAKSPVAHVTWKDVPADSELLGTKPSDIEETVVTLRDEYEDTHGKYRWVLDHLYAVVRRIDFRRTQSQNAILDENLTPAEDGVGISEHVDAVIPERMRPDRLEGGDPDGVASPDDDTDDADDAPIEETVSDVVPDEKPTQPAATDGGESRGEE